MAGSIDLNRNLNPEDFSVFRAFAQDPDFQRDLIADYQVQIRAINAGRNGGDGCCSRITRICRAVANFFKVIAKAICTSIAWVFKTLCCCCWNFNHNGNGPQQLIIDQNRFENIVDHFPYNMDLLNGAADQNPLIRDYRGAVDDDGWQVTPNEWLLDQVVPAEAAVPIAPASPILPRIISAEMRVKQIESLARLNEIKNRLNQNAIRFDVAAPIINFNCDKAFRPFAVNTPATRLGELLNYAGAEVAKPYNRNDPRDSVAKHAQRVSNVNVEHMNRTARFNNMLQRHPDGYYAGDKGAAAKRSLSQIFNILNAKKGRADQGRYDLAVLKNEIRWVATSINDAHSNCIDQINAQLEFIKLKIIITELGNEFNAINIFGAHALFQYRSNLLSEICYHQNPGEEHLADIVLAIKHQLANLLNLESSENVGAQHNFMVTPQMVPNAQAEFLRLYNEQPPARSHDRRPLAYLKEGLKSYLQQGPLQDLRTMLIDWITEDLYLDANQADEQDDQVIKQIIAAASVYPGDEPADPNDAEYVTTNFKGRGPFNEAGMLWLLKEAGIIREV